MRSSGATVAIAGRRREMAVVARLVGAAGAGVGGALLITGEAGIGKSRLVTETVALARSAGLAVLTGRAVPGGGTYRAVAEAVLGHVRDSRVVADAPQLRPFRAALDRLAPGWVSGSVEDVGANDGLGGGGPDPVLMLGEGVLRMLAVTGGGRGSLLVLEDLHCADADTIAVVEYLAGAVRGSPVLLLVSARDDQPGQHNSVAVARLAGREDVTTLRLDRLDSGAVRELAFASADGTPIPDDVMERLVAQAEGLPLLVGELLDGLLDPLDGDPVPPTLAGLVAGRMAELAPPRRRVLQAAAVLGTEPDWSLIAPVSGVDEAAALEGLRAGTGTGLLLRDGRRLRWRHSLTRDAVLATLLPPEHAALARRAADVLAARAGPHDDDLAADLLVAAGETTRATAVLMRLVRRDAARGALHSAQELIDRAVAAGATRAQVVIDQVRLLTLSGHASTALDTGSAALAELTGDEHAELCLELARGAVTCGRFEQAKRYLDRAGRPADPRSAVLATESEFGMGDVDLATELAGAAIEVAERAGSPDALCAALVVAGRCAAARARPADASAAFGRAAQSAAEHGLLPWRIEALFGLGLLELEGQVSTPSLDEARELAVDTGLLGPALSIDVIRTESAMTVDGPAAAEPMARRVAERAARLRLSGLQALAELSVAAGRAVAGDVEGMATLLDAAGSRAHASLEVAALAPAVQALPHLLARDLPRANAVLDSGMSMLVGHGSAAPVAFWGPWVLLRTVVADRDTEAREYLRTAPVGRRDVNRAALAYADAVAAGRAGRTRAASDLMVAADALIAARPWWGRLLRLTAMESAVADGWGDPVPALRADLTVFERTGEHQLARTARDLLRQAGAPTRRGRGSAQVPPALRAMGVTSREMDVLLLVAEGLTNAEVGGRLFLSPRTVESHVANLLAKTGTGSRAELRAFAQPAP
jgi:DNA-binding CsgD family transcriptional regulator